MTLLETRDLTRHFGALAATRGVNLTVNDREIHALIGPNGAGKTTLVNLLTGALTPTSGSVLMDGQDITRLPTYARVQRGLARTYQITSVYDASTVHDNLALAVQARHGSSFRFWRPVRHERSLYEEAASIATQVGLEGRLATPAASLAHGERRQLEVALALATNPRVLLLDEPMAGLGGDETGRMVDLIASLATTRGVLLIEHDMDAVFRLASRISVLVYGEVIATGAPDAIRGNTEVQRAYLGDEHAVA